MKISLSSASMVNNTAFKNTTKVSEKGLQKLGEDSVKLELSSDFVLQKSESVKVSYNSLFNSRISAEEIEENGVSNKAFEIYNSKTQNANGIVDSKGDLSFEDKLQDSVKKYDTLAKAIKEEFGHVPNKFNSEMEKLNKAFEVNTRSIIDNGKVDVSMMELINEKKSLLMGNKVSGSSASGVNDKSYRHTDEVAKKFTDSFLDAYKKGEDVSKIANSLMKDAFPDVTESMDSISYKDFQIISDTKESFYNKGTGMDILNSLANNKDLSPVLREGFKKLYEGESVYGSGFSALI